MVSKLPACRKKKHAKCQRETNEVTAFVLAMKTTFLPGINHLIYLCCALIFLSLKTRLDLNDTKKDKKFCTESSCELRTQARGAANGILHRSDTLNDVMNLVATPLMMMPMDGGT